MNKSKFEVEIKKAMLDEGVNMKLLSEKIKYNNQSNLITAIKTGTLGDKYLVRLCVLLKKDVGEMFKLKLQARNESSK